MDNTSLIYLHGSESDSNSGKARQFREWFPGMVTPDFKGSFEERMIQLQPILVNKSDWTIIGSSYGGLMGTVYTCKNPTRVRKLILLAPALLREPFGSFLDPSTGSGQRLQPASVPVTVIHGTRDDVVPLEAAREVAQTLFTNLKYIVVDDDHRLHKTLHELDWKKILK
ncbi:MAG TPA: alpha/beta fold hydrolase [Anaerolineales bacterium]|nr:alpha/beta fold hydrolase [Anaerolineales bacterium]